MYQCIVIFSLVSFECIIYDQYFTYYIEINPLSTKVYLSDLKTHFIPRSKHSLLLF